MIGAMRQLFACVAVLLLLACSSGGAQQPSAGTPGAQDTAAQVGGRSITVKELDDRWRETDAAASAQALQALYDGRRAALDDIIASMLIEQAATAKNQTVAQFIDAELARRATPVTDTEIAIFYGENRGQMQGRTLEQMSALIRGYLENQKRQGARAALVAELRKAGPPVRVMIDAPRQEVAIAADDPSIGPANAPVTIIEFSDFQCPFCQRVVPTLKQVQQKYGDRVRIVWKDFPLTQIHPQAFDAARAGNCAQEQGKFWEFHDQLFANQGALEIEALKRYAAAAGLDGARFAQCVDSGKYQARVQAGLEAGGRLGIGSTPTTFINGRVVTGAQPLDVFVGIIDEELARAGR